MGERARFETCIHDYRVNRRKEKSRYVAKHYKEMQESFCGIMAQLIQKQILLQQTGGCSKVSSLCFWHLLSSDYTGSYEIAVGLCGKRLQMDEHMAYVYWKPEILYEGIDHEAEALEKFLRRCFRCIEEYDLLQLKRQLLMDDWLLFGKTVKTLAGSAGEKLLKSKVYKEEEVQVLFGEYSGQMFKVCRIGGTKKEL